MVSFSMMFHIFDERSLVVAAYGGGILLCSFLCDRLVMKYSKNNTSTGSNHSNNETKTTRQHHHHQEEQRPHNQQDDNIVNPSTEAALALADEGLILQEVIGFALKDANDYTNLKLVNKQWNQMTRKLLPNPATILEEWKEMERQRQQNRRIGILAGLMISFPLLSYYFHHNQLHITIVLRLLETILFTKILLYYWDENYELYIEDVRKSSSYFGSGIFFICLLFLDTFHFFGFLLFPFYVLRRNELWMGIQKDLVLVGLLQQL